MSIKEKLANHIYTIKSRTDDFDLAKWGVFFTILKLLPKFEKAANILEVINSFLTKAINRFVDETISFERQLTDSHKTQLHKCLNDTLRFLDETYPVNDKIYYQEI